MTASRGSPIIFTDMNVTKDGGNETYGIFKLFLFNIGMVGVEHRFDIGMVHKFDQMSQLFHRVTEVTFEPVNRLGGEKDTCLSGIFTCLMQYFGTSLVFLFLRCPLGKNSECRMVRPANHL